VALKHARAPANTGGTTYHPELYALVHCGTPGDERLYLDAAHGAQRILELGCGYGRLLGPLARAGHRVTGLELDRGLLALAHAAIAELAAPEHARVTLVHGDMRDFALAERFERVFIPFSGVYCLPSEADLVACLQRVRAHLAPGGMLVFDAYVIDAFHAAADPQEDDPHDGEPVASVAWRGTTYEVFETTTWDRPAQRLHVTYRYQPRGDGTPLFGSICHRYLLTSQVEGICARAGLRLIDTGRDLDGAALSPESDHMVCMATPV
jgi:SAM-dependent methyltransferase